MRIDKNLLKEILGINLYYAKFGSIQRFHTPEKFVETQLGKNNDK